MNKNLILIIIPIVIVIVLTQINFNDFILSNLDDKKVGTTRPNVILIMTDDVSVSMVDFLLGKKMMPNLQENIIDNGITFTNSFVSSPLCCPSRATTLTGLYPHNHGILHNIPVFINETQVVKGGFKDFNDTSTISTWLQKEDYLG